MCAVAGTLEVLKKKYSF
uniref:Uncharacterized protein n=1 Tax=Vitis vinifera TaxID=29760 RepID=F6HH10_VITVI